MSMNIVILTGRLTRDPEIKYTQSGKAQARFTLAVNKSFSKTDEADFINCVAWDKKAEFAGEYLRKGMLIGIQGRLSVRNYEDENKQKRTITEVIVDTTEFLESKKNKSGDSEEYTAPAKHAETADSIPDDEFPF